MIVENHLMEENGVGDHFPVGMRILIVDDDEVFLKVLEKMLHKCQYHVTATTESIKALEMLRENKNKFDLVISDVIMPHMDGFKLLEFVGLEMDLPIIMLSGDSDTKQVMKGVTHGACDYLIKPPKIEVLQNIWQHVLRKKIDCKDKNKPSNEGKAPIIAGEGSQGIASEINAYHSKNLFQKRKEPNEEDEEQEGKENEEPSTQKKPRLLWNAQLHKKFVDAVNQLGVDKAIPKRILDLMNVEGITREHVASHLQKYRLALKKATDQGSMVVGLGCSNPCVQMSSINRHENFNTLSGSGRILTTTPQHSYTSGGMFGRQNCPTGFNLRGMGSSELVGPIQSHYINRSIKSIGNIQLPRFAANQSSSLSQGIPKSIELNQFLQSKNIVQFNPIGGLGSSALVRPIQSHIINSSINSLANIQQPMFAANQSSSLSQGIPKSIELNQFQQSNNIVQFNPIGGSTEFTDSSTGK